MTQSRWMPALGRVARDYSWPAFGHDVIAGVTVGLVALPLAMAFAIASGLKPEQGIYCAIVTGFLISALGGSRYQIGGPTGAFVVVVAGIVATYGLDGLYMCTMMAGVILLILGVTGMGASVKYLPRPVVIGFTNGIAVLIASTQLRDFFGLQLPDAPSEFTARMAALARHAGTWSPPALAFGAAALALMIGLRRFTPRVPGAILALIGGTAAVMLGAGGVETVGSRFGGIPAGLPHLAIPQFHASLIPTLFRPALDGGAARGHRVAPVRGGRGSDGARSPQSERRADRPGRREHRVTALRRPAGDGRDRADRDQHPGRRAHAGGRDGPCRHAAGGAARRRAAGRVHSDARARRHPPHGVVEHGRVARDPEAAAADEDGRRRVAGDVRADGLRRSRRSRWRSAWSWPA